MNSKLVAQGAGERTFVLILDPGEEIFTTITKFTVELELSAASLTAIGAFSFATVGWFDLGAKTYRKIPVNEQCEVLSAIGDIALNDEGNRACTLHVVLGLGDGSTRGGHLLAGDVQPTLEVMLVEAPAHLRRKQRPELALALIDLDA
jgi:hypothetical protein